MGIELKVDTYCSYCPDFEPHVEKLDLFLGGCITTVTCEYAARCSMLMDHLRNFEENKEKNGEY